MLNHIFLLLSTTVAFYILFWQYKPYQWKGLWFGLATGPMVFTSFTKPILFLCWCKGFHVIIYLDDVLVMTHSMCAGKRAQSFLCSLLLHLGLDTGGPHLSHTAVKPVSCLAWIFCQNHTGPWECKLVLISQITDKPDRFSCSQKIQLKRDPPVLIFPSLRLASLSKFLF